MITSGRPLPSMPLVSTRCAVVDLSAHAGRAVVFVYPYTGRPGVPDPPGWDDIPGAHGSTPLAQGFAELAANFGAAGWGIFGLSAQPSACQTEAVARLKLPFALLSDERFAFADALGLPRFCAGDRTYLSRLTLLVEAGVAAEIVHPVLDPAGHARAVLQIVRARSPA